MVIGEFFYTLFVWPIRFILEFLCVLFIRIFDEPGLSVLFLSTVVNTLSLPIYLIADRWQKEGLDLQKKMKHKIDRIKVSFKGDERQMILNTYYRQMGYSQLFVLKASVGLLLQIPFFIAAYQFLSRTNLLSGASFLFLRDLKVPDALLSLSLPFLGITAINIMPILMTVLNLVSSFIYAKDMGKRELARLLVMALVFLVLLYNSPSGLVLYWTMNNLYSLLKNAAQAYLKKPGRVLHIAAVLAALVFVYMIWSGKASVERYRMFFTGISLLFAAVPFAWNPLVNLFGKLKGQAITESINDEKTRSETGKLFFSSVALLFLLLTFLNPAQVLSASVSDFERPWSFLGRTVLQGFSFLVLIPLFIRALSPPRLRRVIAIVWAVLALNSVICYFALSANYGVMDRNFRLDDTDRLLHAFPAWVSLIVPLASVTCVVFFIYAKREKILSVVLQAACAAVLMLGLVNLVSLGKGYADLAALLKREDQATAKMPVYFPLSKTEPNVFIVFLDRAQGSAMSDALEFMPSLKKDLDGFVFYPNTLSFGSCTVTGVPAMLGGYDYTPEAINSRSNELLVDKVNSAITLMPRLFGERGYRVMITDPVIANMQSVPDVSIFKDLPNVSARLLSGTLSDRYYSDVSGAKKTESDTFDFDILFRYGIFRAAPPALRYGIHYKGQWWKESAYNSYGRAVGEFSSLYYLPEICSVDAEGPSLTILMNAITHEAGAYNADYMPQEDPVQFSDEEKSRFGSEENAVYMYTLLSGMNQLVKWIDYLKAENIYDNTRIIVVSDHGGNYRSRQEDAGMGAYNALFMVKEFGKRGDLTVSDTFMTHSDTPYVAASGLFENTLISGGAEFAQQKKHGDMTAFSAVSSQPLRHGPNQFNLESKRALTGRDVSRKESWGSWERY